jgi:hypothetical protein
MTQRLVPGAGKSAIVSGLPLGPITYFGLGRMAIVIKTLTLTTKQLNTNGTRVRLKFSYVNPLKFKYACRSPTPDSNASLQLENTAILVNGLRDHDLLTAALHSASNVIRGVTSERRNTEVE